MYNTDKKQLRAFARKMRNKGAAGFAAGPWNETEESAGMTTDHAIPGVASERGRERAQPAGNILDRLLAGIAILSFLIVAAGAVGIYLSHERAGTASSADIPATGAGTAVREPPDKPLPMAARPPAEGPSPPAGEQPLRIPAAADQPPVASTVPDDDGMHDAGPEVALPVGQDAGLPAEEEPVQAPEAADQPPAANAVPDTADMHDAEPEVALPVEQPPGAKRAAEPQPAQVPAAVAVQEPVEDATPDVTPPAPPAAGAWIVNLASYANNKTADRMLEEFRQQGVVAESLAVTVRGKPMHRLRITGFGTRQAAEARAEVLREQLDLDGIWITKR